MDLPIKNPRGYRFGVFEVDLRAGELRKHGLKIKFQDQPFKVLAMLLERAPEVVSREELRAKLWSEDTFVDFDHSLSIAVNKVREALRDSAEFPRYVETLPKRGYRFVAPVALVPSATTPASANGNAKDSAGQNSGTSSQNQNDLSSVGQARAEGGAADPKVEQESPTTEWIATAEPASRRRKWKVAYLIAMAGAALFALGILYRTILPHSRAPLVYTQLTDFADAAYAPAISPDGRMVAFLRGDAGVFATLGQVYMKLLPNGDAVQLTKDPRLKYGLAFSPDGTRITYTATDPVRWGWDTVSVSALGGEPNLLFLNAAGLTWLDDHRVLFSEVKKGLHMGVVTASGNRSEPRDIYLPQHERAMAPYAFASPDRKWVLVVEKNESNTWQPCRVVAYDGRSAGWQIGPLGPCTSGAWTPDGTQIYLTATVNGTSHLWRQPFPKGDPEQITFGPAEEQGVAMAPDGRSLITSVGNEQSSIWVRDSKGDRQISSEGNATFPSFSPDASQVYYLLRRQGAAALNELWSMDLNTGRNRPVVEGVSISRYDISPNGKEVVFDTDPKDKQSSIWLSPLDQSAPPAMVSSTGENRPYWGPSGDLLFRKTVDNKNILFRMDRKGTSRRIVFEHPINQVQTVSPDRNWATAMAPMEGATTAVIAIPIGGGAVKRICPGICNVRWSSDGEYFYFRIQDDNETYSGKLVAIPIPRGRVFPDLPTGGLASMEQAAKIPGSILVDLSDPETDSIGANVFAAPGLAPGVFVYVKTMQHRNLFQIPLN